MTAERRCTSESADTHTAIIAYLFVFMVFCRGFLVGKAPQKQPFSNYSRLLDLHGELYVPELKTFISASFVVMVFFQAVLIDGSQALSRDIFVNVWELFDGSESKESILYYRRFFFLVYLRFLLSPILSDLRKEAFCYYFYADV